MSNRQDRPLAKKLLHALGLLALALFLLYVAVQFVLIFHRSYKTETAIRYTLAESLNLTGVVAFDAVDVPGSGNLGYLVQDGERVTNGTVVAECYTDDTQGLQRERLDRLERSITLLTKSQNSAGSELSVLTNQTKQALYNLLDKLDTAQYTGISDAQDSFLLAQNRLQISTGQTADFSQSIAALQTEYDGIKAQLDTLQTVTATTNGYFSRTEASPAVRTDCRALADAELVRNAQAALGAGLLPGRLHDGGVDELDHILLFPVRDVRLEHDDGAAQHADLRRGKADAVGLGQRLAHIVEQHVQPGIKILDLVAVLAQLRVSVFENHSCSHIVSLL